MTNNPTDSIPLTTTDERDCLVVIDVQNDFCDGGALAVSNGEEVVPVINGLIEKFQHVVFTQDWHPAGHVSFASSHPGRRPFEMIKASYGDQILWPDHCVQGTQGAEFHASLNVSAAELILRKGFHPDIDSYSAFLENDHHTPTGLVGYLRERGLSRLFLTGLATDYCVRFSAEDARRKGFVAYVIEDACRAIDLEGSLQVAWTAMEACAVNRIASSEISART